MRLMERASSIGRLMGLGRPPSDPGVLGAVANQGFAQVPVIEYVTWTTTLPISNVNAAHTFPAGNRGVDILSTDSPLPGIDFVDTSFVRNGILQCDLYVIGFGAHIFAEPMTFSQIGNVLTPMPTATFAPPVSPDVFTQNDFSLTVASAIANNTLGVPVTTPPTQLIPAIMKWGHDTWEAVWHFANAFQFVWRFNQRQILIQELVADVCYFGPYADAIAAGTSEVDVQEYARRINDRMREPDVGGTGIFVPINARRIGSVTSPPPLAATGNVGVFHPTRDFDLAPVTYGGLRNQGATGCCNPFRKLPCPTLLAKGIPIGMQLMMQDNVHYKEFLRHIELSDFGAAATLNQTSFDVFASNLTAALPAVATNRVMPELTLDLAPNVVVGQQVDTSRVIVKGGTIKFAILIKGYEAWGPWVEYLTQERAANEAALAGVNRLT